jgi:hypothetical protein
LYLLRAIFGSEGINMKILPFYHIDSKEMTLLLNVMNSQIHHGYIQILLEDFLVPLCIEDFDPIVKFFRENYKCPQIMQSVVMASAKFNKLGELFQDWDQGCDIHCC